MSTRDSMREVIRGGSSVNAAVEEMRAASATVEMLEKRNKEAESERVRSIADGFVTFSKVVLVFFCIAAIIVGMKSIDGSAGDVVWLLYVGCAAVGAAAWCYSVAQLIYIRAALEK